MTKATGLPPSENTAAGDGVNAAIGAPRPSAGGSDPAGDHTIVEHATGSLEEPPGGSPDSNSHPPGWPPGWVRFRCLGLLGSGGMGQVFEAWDPGLRRPVAVKLLRSEDPELVQRFVREAQAQARVDHPHVCKVFEVGEVGGRPFIAMQVVHGDPLSLASSRLSIEQKALLVRQVAEALHAAHKLGLVHRDLKPGNIMVERAEDGSLHPYVVDFGLVRELGAETLTLEGSAVGTPSFMAPEQAAGETARIDRRTDVYALGATLYAALAGQPPFAGSSAVEVLRRVLDEEPRPLAAVVPGVPTDLATIVMKCLEKDPVHRYDSARALASDLGRFLDGEPIAARPASLIYRLGKRVRRNRLAFGLGAAAALVTLVLGGAWLLERRDAARRAAVAQRFGEQARDMEWVLRAEHLSPPHDLRPVRNELRARVASLDAEIKALGAAAEGPGRMAIGRALLALGDVDAARDHLQKAWNVGHRTPESAYLLGACLGELYRFELERIRGLTGMRQNAGQIAKAQAELRDPALALLRQCAGAKGVSPAYVEGLIALYEERMDDGFAHARAITDAPPWSYDADMLAGSLCLEAGTHAATRRDPQKRRELLLRARGHFEAARATGRSDPAVQLRMCKTNLYLLSGQVFVMQARVPDQHIDAAYASCEAALSLDPESTEVLAMLAAVRIVGGGNQQLEGGDPSPSYEAAIADCERALRFQSGHRSALVYHAFALKQLGYLRAPRERRGLDHLRAALADYRHLLAFLPDKAETLTNMGDCYLALVAYGPAHGEDILPIFDQAMDELGTGLEAAPESRGLAMSLGSLVLMRSRYEAAHGIDPLPSARRAVECYRMATKGDTTPESHRNLGLALVDLGQRLLERGEAPDTPLGEAIEAAEAAHRINPDYNSPLRVKALALLVRAEHALLTGSDPRPWCDQAERESRAALGLPPPDPDIWLELGAIHLVRVRHETETGRDPSRWLHLAETAFRASRQAGEQTLLLRLEGERNAWRARWIMRGGGDPRATLGAAIDSLRKAAAQPDAGAGEHALLAEVHLDLVRWLQTRGQPAEQHLRSGLAAADTALAINARHAEAHAVRAALLAARDGTADPRSRQQASGALERALTLNPLLARRYAGLARQLGVGRPA